MAVEAPTVIEGARAARDLIDETGRNLRDANSGVPPGFAARLFGRAAPEDLTTYEAVDLALLVRTAWAFLATRRPGTPKIRFDSAGDGGDSALRGVSVIEIVNDDMPFILDSVMGELTERGLAIRLVVHPIFTVERDTDGRLTAIPMQAKPHALRESLIHIHVERIDDPIRRTEIIQALEHVLATVRVAVRDWREMLARVGELIADLKTNPPRLPSDDVGEAILFLEWLIDNNFTFLGVREYAFSGGGDLEPVPDTGLGVLRNPAAQELRLTSDRGSLQAKFREIFNEPKTLLITKSDMLSPVHRRVAMDYVGIKRFDADGNPAGEFRIVGLLTSTAYTRSVRSIPYLRRKVEMLMARTGFDPHSHSGKALVNVLESFPRDELFRISDDRLHEFALAILQLDERPRVRVLPRRDRFDRFVSVLAYVPRERYDSRVRRLIGEFLAEAFGGEVTAFHPFFPEGLLARVHFIITRTSAAVPNPSRAALEYGVGAIVRTWNDALGEMLALSHEPERAHRMFARYGDAFSEGYHEHYAPSVAVEDIRVIETLSFEHPLGVDFHLRTAGKPCIALKVWSYGRPIALSERVPILENMGFRVVDERTFDVKPKGGDAPIWLHDIVLERAEEGALTVKEIKPQLESCFIMVMRGVAENDGYNALVLAAGLMWRDIALLRTFSRFLRQIRTPYSQDYMWATLRKHAAVTPKIIELFAARFDPRFDIGMTARGEREGAIVADIEQALNAVDSLDEDRILRRFINAVKAAVRTNFYQLDRDGRPAFTIAIKFASGSLDDMPLPKPLYEIFVYSPRLEGVHLRFGKVARGGIRWSDRPQDFRTEILGLVKAQNVKNAVIVPVGSKGGFVPKLIPKNASREAVQAEGVAIYKIFISALLDITDNFGGSGVIAPDNVVRHDGDDPYLVVAADKGTATFSDIANGIAADHHYWLDDAFASGGSAGYDHKVMGITARGAWESVKRHFREMDTDIGVAPFTVVGVGDMSGDVFGNGMLRETTTKLVAAFDHRDIFIDPNPDPEKSFQERARLFALPRSSWQDYDKALISQGGGIFQRGAKEIRLTPEIQALLGLTGATATPPQVMTAILKAQVDLLWFGGIGTYVRASSETDDAAGDRANDPIRVTGADLRCKAIGEGANLGMTQRGRIEAALCGIRLNTDAIDNSAGVNTSDVEVNIKIALSLPMRENRLTLPDRNALLVGMTDDVAQLVLRNNYLQTLALALAERRGLEDTGFQQRLMHVLETRGELNRTVEFLPDDMELAERRRRSQPLTRPELAVLLAYAKLSLYGELLESPVPDDPYLGRELGRYFPDALAERFPEALEQHRLRREIIATQLANSMINRGGPSLIVRIADQTGAAAATIAYAFAAVRNSYDLIALNGEIDALDGRISGAAQLGLYAEVQNLLLDRLVWFIRNCDFSKGLAAIIGHYQEGISAVEAALDTALPAHETEARSARIAEWSKHGVSDALAKRIADLAPLTAAPDIVLIADRSQRGIAEVAATYFAAGAFFQLDRITGAAQRIEAADYFDRLALDRARDTLGEAERRLTADMLTNGKAGSDAVSAWVEPRKAEIERIRAAMHEIATSGLTVSKVSVAANLLSDLAKE